MTNKRWVFGLLITLAILTTVLLANCSQGAEEPEPAEEPEAEAEEAEAEEPEAEEPEEEAEEEAAEEPEEEVDEAAEAEAAWAASGHADAEAEAFNHWNEDDPPEVEVACAKCHSTPGFLDFLGEDGSAFGSVESPAEIGTTVTCEVCHNATAESLDSVVFPSGAEITGLGASARCMQCHQGRASGSTVDEAIADLPLDSPSPDLGFINIHYYAAAASLFGSEAHGGYEYAGKSYQIRNAHVEGYRECIDCHDQHSLEVKVEACSECHDGVASVEDLQSIRMQGSLADYDGDGDVSEGISSEIAGLREMLAQAISAYATQVAGTPIVYDSLSYPYFFIDDGNGVVDEGENAFPNQYASWTPRLLQAAYNYQVSLKDPGAYAHNPKYHVALLYDSIESLNEAIAEPVDLSTASRNDAGHFDGTAEAFRHWDEEDPAEVPDTCSRCHSAEGLPLFLAEGTTAPQQPANSFACSTCHTFDEGIQVRESAEVTFPSGAVLTFPDNTESNLCMNCHQGRSWTGSVNEAIAGLDPDEPNEELGFINIHYFAAGATLFGTEAQGAYEYEGKSYAGRNNHVPDFNTCTECHNVHALEVQVEGCAECHGSEDPATFRIDPTDWDGDGDTTEGVVGEIETMRDALLVQIQAYARSTAGTPIVYAPVDYPYFFIDTNANGAVDEGENIYPNLYVGWTPRLLQAAYNYQYASKDPGAFAHNSTYVIQVLYDSLEDMGGNVSAMTRPE